MLRQEPITQLLALALDKVPGFVPPPDFDTWDMPRREKEVRHIVFQPFIDKALPGSVARMREAAKAAVPALPQVPRVVVRRDGAWVVQDVAGGVVEEGAPLGDPKKSAPYKQLAAAVAGLDFLLGNGDVEGAIALLTDSKPLHDILTKARDPSKDQRDLYDDYEEACESLQVRVFLKKVEEIDKILQ